MDQFQLPNVQDQGCDLHNNKEFRALQLNVNGLKGKLTHFMNRKGWIPAPKVIKDAPADILEMSA